MARAAAILSTFAVLAQASETLLRGSTQSESRRLDQQQGEQCGNSGSTGFFYGKCSSGLRCVPPAEGAAPGTPSICHKTCGSFGEDGVHADSSACSKGQTCTGKAAEPCRWWAGDCYMYCEDANPAPSPPCPPAPTPSPPSPPAGCSLLGGEQNFHGRNMDGFTQSNSDAQACERHCEGTDGCVGFTLYAGVCYLKDIRWGEPWHEAGAESGYCGEVRDCTYESGKNNDCEGSEGDDSCNLFQVAGSDGQKPFNAQDCLDACASYSQCRSYTWTFDQCWLKRTNGGSMRDDLTATSGKCKSS